MFMVIKIVPYPVQITARLAAYSCDSPDKVEEAARSRNS
jgi:hypothetical protein